jgi:putative intracellular protease/amidase
MSKLSIRAAPSVKPATSVRPTQIGNIDNCDFFISKRASVADIINMQLEKMLKISPKRRSGKMPMEDFSGLKQVQNPIIDVKKAYIIICSLESRCSYAIGDSGTSFGATQVQFGSFLSGLARDPKTKEITGIDPVKFKRLSKTWNTIKKSMRGQRFWKAVPVDENKAQLFMKNNPRSIIKRREGTTIRANPGNIPGFIKIKNGKFIGYEFDIEKLHSMGLDVNKYMPAIQKIAAQYITGAVAHNAIVKLFVKQSDPTTYATFINMFSRRSVNSNRALRNLSDRISQRDFMNKINHVLSAVEQSGYDTTAPGAYNIYQLVGIANSSGAGRVAQFLKRKKKFYAGNLHYLRRANPIITKITGVPSSTPSQDGMAGFTNNFSKVKATSLILSKRADEGDFYEEDFYEEGFSEEEFEGEEKTISEPQDVLYKFNYIYRNFMKEIDGNPDLKNQLFEEFLQEEDVDRYGADIGKLFNEYIKNEIEKYIKENWDILKNWDILPKQGMLLSKRAIYTEPGVLYFPGQYAESIKSGKRRMTIRATDVPVNVDEVVKCMSYSGAHICDLYITSKETMSLVRIRKAFGEHVANDLERKFGADSRFVVIRFDVHEDTNVADDTYNNMNYGAKYSGSGDNLDEDPYSLDTGAIKSLPNLNMAPTDGVGSYNVATRNILMLVSKNSEKEYLAAKNMFAKNGFKVSIITPVEIDMEKISNYCSLFIINSKKEIRCYKNKAIQNLIKTFIRNKKPVALSGYATLLAVETGLVRGRKVTGQPDIMNIVHKAQGIWTGMPVERDGILFTSMDKSDTENLVWVFSNFLLGRPSNRIIKNNSLSRKEAQQRLNNIWKLADELDESELDRMMREQQEEMEGGDEIKTIEEEMDEAYRLDPTKPEPAGKQVKEIKLEPKKKFHPPRKSLKTQMEEGGPELEKKKETPTEIDLGFEDLDLGLDDLEDLDEFGGEKDILAKEEAEKKVGKMLHKTGKKYLDRLKSLSNAELKDNIIMPDDIEESNKSAEEDYTIMISYTMSIGSTPEDDWNKFRKYKELSLEEEGEELDLKEKEELDESSVISEEGPIPIFTEKRLEAPKDKSGEVIDHWPKIKIPEMSTKAAKIFYSEGALTGSGLRKIFNNIDSWSVLKKEPHLLQSWVLPAIIMAVGYRFFEINSVQSEVGRRSMKGKGVKFKHLAGGAPFGMLDDIDENTVKRMSKGEISVEDLPQSKRYIQEIIRLVTEYTNTYFSKDYADPSEGREKPIPVDAYIYSSLKYEMTRQIADAHDYKEQRAPICAVCKGKYSRNKAIEKMEHVSRGIYKCLTCERAARALTDNDLAQINHDINVADEYLNKFDKKISILTAKINSAENPQEKKELEEQELYLREEADGYRLQSIGLVPRKKEIQEKISMYGAQSVVPRWHTWCPNDRCPGKRVPLNSVDWNNEIWNTGEGKNLKNKLKETYGIVQPGEMEQNAEEVSPNHQVSEALSWIKVIPFVCPHDGEKFKMGEVEGQGYKGRAGFFWEPYTKLIWTPKGKIDKGTYEELEQQGVGPNKARDQLDTYQYLSDIGQQLARKQYYEFFNRLRYRMADERAGKSKPIPKKRKKAQHRYLYLYDTVKDFSFEDPVSYVAWMSGSLVYKKPVIEGDAVTNQNVIQQSLPYDQREDLIYQPILQRWVDKMLKEGAKEVDGDKKDPYKIFNLHDWLVNEDADRIPSDGPGTYFISKIEGEVSEDEGGMRPYGFKCVLESKRKLTKRQRSKEWDKRGPRLVRVLDLWKLTDKDMKMLTENQKNGKDPIPRSMATTIINKTKKESMHGDISYHDYHDVALDSENTSLVPGNYVLVQALIMPGKSEWGPLRYIRQLEKNKEGFEFWDKFYELTALHKDEPKYWKEFAEKIKHTKDYLYHAEILIDRELAMSKKRGEFSISLRAEKSPLSAYKNKRKFGNTP